jgi:ABC-type Fe3+-hydroxamate transport system substrate-binding protein
MVIDGVRVQRAAANEQNTQRAKAATLVVDASSHALPVANYRRILSCSSVADAILMELVPTEQIVGVSRWYAEASPNAWRLAGKPRLSGPQELEKIIELRPDLIVVSNYTGDSSSVERLREQGYRVFELGPMLGQVTLERNLSMLSQLLGLSAEGERLVQHFRRRMNQVAAHVPESSRKRGIYLNLYDTQLHGGTLGSSYYDVLTSAGLRDVAAKDRVFARQGEQAWPRFRVEDVLVMAPDVIVTVTGKGRQICGLSGLERLAACRDPRGIVELDEGQLNDPGFGMLTTAEIICDRVYPRKPSTVP